MFYLSSRNFFYCSAAEAHDYIEDLVASHQTEGWSKKTGRVLVKMTKGNEISIVFPSVRVVNLSLVNETIRLVKRLNSWGELPVAIDLRATKWVSRSAADRIEKLIKTKRVESLLLKA